MKNEWSVSSLPMLPNNMEASTARKNSRARELLEMREIASSMTADDYASDVLAIVRNNTTDSSRYPASNFERLATYLKRPSIPPIRHMPHSNGQGQAGPDFLFVHTIRSIGRTKDSQEESQSSDGNCQQPTAPQELDPAPRIVFLRGQPSSEWLPHLGAKYGIDPEFFRRHLDFLSTAGRENHYTLPSLPSYDTVIQLSYFTISKAPVLKSMLDDLGKGSGPDVIDELRRIAPTQMEQYITRSTQTTEDDKGLGDSIVRDFHIFDNLRFVLEQRISLTVTKLSDGEHWIALVWIDTGKDLTHGPQGPWSHCLALYRSRRAATGAFLPTIQAQPFEALKYQPTLRSNHETQFAQSSALLHLNYGVSLNAELSQLDAFYSFQEVFDFCAYSNVQFLNLIDESISAVASSSRASDSQSQQAHFMYVQSILDKHERSLEENVRSIKSRGMAWWPRPDNEQQRNKCQKATDSLLRDYEALLARSTKLKDRCQSHIDNLATQAMLAESKKAIDQANEVTKLTRMAFFFIPLSFTCSIFGMNVHPIVDDAPQIWIWVIITIPIVSLAFSFLRWTPRELYELILRRMGPDSR